MRGKPDDYWGKAKIDPAGAVQEWHPLSHHMVDVGCAFQALADTGRYRHSLSMAAGTPLTSSHVARLSVIALLHDLGKLNLGFQAKILPEDERPTGVSAGHVAEACILLAYPSLRRRLVAGLDLAQMSSWFTDGLERALLASWSHHGSPVRWSFSSKFGIHGAPAASFDGWRYANLDRALAGLREMIARHWPEAFERSSPIVATPKFLETLSGMISLADWLGSDTRVFPYSTSIEEARFDFAIQAARKMLADTGIDTLAARHALSIRGLSFQRTFGFAPNAMQQATMGCLHGVAA